MAGQVDQDGNPLGERIDVTCTRCGRVSYAVSPEAGATMIRDARRDYLRRHPAQLGRAPSLDSGMLACWGCGGTGFRPAKDGDCPPGCTIGPVIWDALQEAPAHD